MKIGWIVLGGLVLVGCASVEPGAYKPRYNKEKVAFSEADHSIAPADVRANFHILETRTVAWVGVIKEVQFKETERTIQVAFWVDHRPFDWKNHGGRTPYQLASVGDGEFVAGWEVQKPARISKLKTLAKPGYMILVYGTPYQMKGGVIQLKASAVRPVAPSDYSVVNFPVVGKE